MGYLPSQIPSSIRSKMRQELSKVERQMHNAVRPISGVSTSEVHRTITKAIQEARRKI